MFCDDVLVAVPVVVAKALCCQDENGEEMYQNVKRTCGRAELLVCFWWCSRSRLQVYFL